MEALLGELSEREARLLATELAFGRVRQERWGPRRLDLDLILYGSPSPSSGATLVQTTEKDVSFHQR
jgi:2-amino-4-hydroxy-6-hydroxymethyldihydropteridine diphosphokinase